MKARMMRGAVIGAGYFAGYHAEAWRRMPGVEIVAAVDPAGGRSTAFAERWGLPRAYTDAQEMLRNERPDFVDIVAPPAMHLALVTLAADHGAQVICQKPMAPTWEECVAMIAAVHHRGVRLLIHENWRWQPWFREIKRMLDEGFCGEVFHAAFRMRAGDGRGPEPYVQQPYFREMKRLLVYEMLVHFLDTFRFLVGEIATVYCRLQRINPAIVGEDCALIELSFASGAQGLIDANRFTGPAKPAITNATFEIEGRRGAIRVTPEGDIWLNNYEQPERLHEFARPETGYKGDSVFAAQKHYISCLREGVACETEGADYLKTVASVLACYESAETGEAVDVIGS